MSQINKIENAIKELEGGKFQNLGDAYLRRKYHFENLVSLGSQEGTDKTTKGIPDSYAEKDDKYIYIMYGTHKSVIPKLKEDIQSVKEKILDEKIDEDKVGRIICCHISSNIEIKQKEELEKLAEPYELELIGINNIANDLTKLDFQYLAKDYLSISESTEQVWNIDDFMKIHDSSKTNAPISNDYIGDISDITNLIISSENQILLISAKPGTGKTRLAIEICSSLDRSKYNILCIKSNNQSIYQDVKSHLDSQKENIIFIDDVNITQNYIPTLGLLNTDTNVKFILTVRDYAENEVIANIKEFKYESIEPNVLKDNNFTQLLNQFSKHDFSHGEIKHINTISKGNPRIAVIAVKLSSSQDLANFNDEVDILKDYYEEILTKNNITHEGQKVLFILSYLKKIRLDNLADNQEFTKLLQITDITEKEFRDGVERLHERELCNIYNNKIVKIADQSLDDYIVIKFLINKKVSVLEILRELYPLNNQKVVQILNQFSNFIKKESDVEIVSDAVKKHYSENSFKNGQDEEKFLTQFGVLLPLEAISYIKNKIDNIEIEDYTRDSFIDEKNKKTTIKDSILLIVHTISRTNYYKHALQLLIKYFAKKPNRISEVYTILEENYGLVTTREYIYYNIAGETIVELNKFDLYQRYNQELVVTILKQYFKIEVEKATANGDTGIFRRYTVPDGDNLKKYHKNIMELLAKLYVIGNSEVRCYIEKLLYDYQLIILKYSDSHPNTIEEDLKNIKELFFSNLANLSMVEEKIVYALHTVEIEGNFSIFKDYKISDRQKVYNSLIKHNYAYLYADNDKLQLQKIANNYSSNWDEIFNFANQFKSDSFMNDRNIELVLFNMFQKVNNDSKMSFLDSMFRANYHFENIVPDRFLEEIEREQIQAIIAFSPESERYKWQFAYLVRLEEVKEEDLQILESLLKNESLPKYFTILDFYKYILVKPSFKEILIQKADDINFVIPHFIKEEEVPRLINLLGENVLKSLYLKNLEKDIDQGCYLFQKLGNDDIDFVVESLKKINKLKTGYSNEASMLLHSIKSFKDAEKIYLIFLNYIISKDSLYYYNSLLETIVEENNNILLKALKGTNSEELAIKFVNLGVEVIDDKSKKIELFKIIKDKSFGKSTSTKIHFSPCSASWSGSYVPVLEQERDFLKNVKEIFDNDMDYIELVIHINKIIDNNTKHIEEELEREF
ncbi:ATP-binding protein [Streptococcus mutans]|uniref:nSTAND3 domain-containing NTPase n=1 Tax=Streptococcus mutans TaxID=1309 RepID=UPI0018AB49DC|nr:ATP-binding protein [Streptococcus mutans]MDB8636749.1 ATP-binding protein [Streptococcus mutans]